MKCEYCEREIVASGKEYESYVMEFWVDVYNHQHTRVLHNANGNNFMDTCLERFGQGIPKDASVSMEFKRAKSCEGDFTMIVDVKTKKKEAVEDNRSSHVCKNRYKGEHLVHECFCGFCWVDDNHDNND